MKPSRIAWLAAVILGVSPAACAADALADILARELETLDGAAGDVWAYSGNGGYVFSFKEDLAGNETDELVVSFSLRPNDWHVFTKASAPSDWRRIGTLRYAGFELRRTPKQDGSSVFARSFVTDSRAQAPLKPFTEYVNEQVVTEAGIASRSLEVGIGAAAEDHLSLSRGRPSDRYSAPAPKLKAILLADLLHGRTDAWFNYDSGQWNRDSLGVYNRRAKDAEKIARLTGQFTPASALALLAELRAADGIEFHP